MPKLDLKYANKKNIPKCPCYACNSSETTEQHRIKPGNSGGTYDNSNVVNLCKRCHSILHKFIRQAKREGNFEEYTWQDFVESTKQFNRLENGDKKTHS